MGLRLNSCDVMVVLELNLSPACQEKVSWKDASASLVTPGRGRDEKSSLNPQKRTFTYKKETRFHRVHVPIKCQKNFKRTIFFYLYEYTHQYTPTSNLFSNLFSWS